MALPTPLQALHDGSSPGDTSSSSDSVVSSLALLETVRSRCNAFMELARQGKADFWDLDETRMDDIEDFVVSLMQRDYGDGYASIPPHGRLRHFAAGGRDRIASLRQAWDAGGVHIIEQVRRLMDLCVVSVLLDAGAGNTWKYTEMSGYQVGRSEGLAIASLAAFEQGLFSSDPKQPYQVDAKGLSLVKATQIAEAMQVNEKNEMVGIDGRAQLLIKLGAVLENDRTFFRSSDEGPHRPGHLVDYLLAPLGKATKRINLRDIWMALINGLHPIWPATRTMLDGKSLGDCWECPALRRHGDDPKRPDAGLVPFHKLTQWMCYSLVEPCVYTDPLAVEMQTMHRIEMLPGIEVVNKDLQTGLPEYRNGGLLIDFGYLNLRKETVLASLGLSAGEEVPVLDAGHPAIVEMRAITVAALDIIPRNINKKLGTQLTCAQVLEAGTWKAGREIAKQKRQDGSPPINIVSDGTVF